MMDQNLKSIPKLLRAIAGTSQSQEDRCDVIFRTAAEIIERLTKALEQISEGTRDEVYPLRAMGPDQMKETARNALSSILPSRL